MATGIDDIEDDTKSVDIWCRDCRDSFTVKCDPMGELCPQCSGEDVRPFDEDVRQGILEAREDAWLRDISK